MRRKLLPILFSVCLVSLVTGLAACRQEEQEKSAYEVYREYYISQNGTENGLLSERDWIAAINGAIDAAKKTVKKMEIICGQYLSTYTDGTTEKVAGTIVHEGHAWNEGTVTTKPTCTTPGVIFYECENCEATKKELLDADGISHIYSEYDWDETHHWQTCHLCGKVEKHEHDFSESSKEDDVDTLLECKCGIHTTVGEYYSFKVNFVCDYGVSVLIYDTQDYSVDGALSTVAYSRSKTGELIKDGEGQVNFEIVPALGYKIKSLLN